MEGTDSRTFAFQDMFGYRVLTVGVEIAEYLSGYVWREGTVGV